jgi:Flp pilus assembly pilin Flp
MFGKLSRLNDALVEWSWKTFFWGADLRRNARGERGQTTLEYLVIVLIMVSLLIAIAMFLSPRFKNLVSNLVQNIISAITNAGTTN